MIDRRTLLCGLAATPFASPAPAAPATHPADAAVGRWAADNSFNGVVLLGRAGGTRFVRAFGLASIADASPASPTTRYAVGSVSKWLTTAAVLRLVDQRRLDLDAPLATWLPSLPGDAGRRVTLGHLLSNTSGIPDRLAAAAKDDPALRTSVAGAKKTALRYVPGDLASAPGERFDYAVLNWVLVRAVLEERTGTPFAPLMRRLVLDPAGLKTVGIAERGFDAAPGLAPAYRSVSPPVRRLDPVPAFAAASGTFHADAAGLCRAAHRVFGRHLLSPAMRRAMLTVRVPEQEYALGGRVRRIDGRDWAWETGKIGGYRAHLAHDVARDRTVVVLNNTDMAQSAITELAGRLTLLA